MRQNNYSLYTALGFVVFATVISVMVGYSAVSYFSAKAKIIEETKQHSKSVITSLQKNIATYIEAYAVNEYEILLLNEMAYEDFLAIIVTDNNMGKVLGVDEYITGKIRDADWNVIDYDPKNKQQNTQLENCFLSETSTISSNSGNRIGTLTICNSDRSVRLALQKTIKEDGIKTVLISILLIFSLFFIIRRIVLRPVSDIVGVLSRSDKSGTPLDNVPANGSREITTLGDSINKMIDAIKHSRLKLEGQNEKLQQFSHAVEQSSATIVIADIDGNIEYVNRKFVESTGYSAEEIIGKNPRLLKSGHTSPEEYEALWETISSGSEWRGEFHNKRKDGSLYWESASISPIKGSDGEIINYIAIKDDITERVLAEDALRESEEKFRSIYQSSNVAAIISVDGEGNVATWNPGAERAFGYRNGEILGQPLVQLIPERYRKAHLKGLKRAQETGKYRVVGKTVELHGLHRDGHEFPLEMSLGAWRSGSKTHFSAIINDITERMQAEEELRKAHDGLELKVAERTKELEAAKHSAEAASLAKSSFLANMSHEIRTPMNGVVGMVDVLMQMNLNPEQRRMIQTIKNSSFALLRIIDDILDSSKIEAGKMELEHVPVRLGPVLEGIVETMVSSADEKNVRLSLFIDPAIPEWVYSDSVRLRQVLLNLTNNAIKFSRKEEGGEQGWVQIRAEYDEEAVIRFTVTDNGIGMSEEVRSRLFKPFSQGEQSTTRQFGGTGLGLVISANLVRLMGGAIEVDSTPGEGTVITVRLPFIEAEGDSKYHDISGLEVLALVDDQMNREALSAYIEGNGSTIRYAGNEAELSSLVLASKGEPIVVLALESMEENDRVREGLTDTEGRRRFLNLTAQRSDRLGLVLPNSYMIQRFPILPSDVLRGLAILAGWESPEVELVTAEYISSASTQTIEEAEAQNRLILLVEDNETNQEVIKYQTNILGYALEIADDGKQGLEMWKTGRFNLVLSDCHMPVMDGFEMTDAIREAEKQTGSPHVPIVAITANALQGEAERCLESGMDDYLSKPVELARLGHALQRWLPAAVEKVELESVADEKKAEMPPREEKAPVDPTAMIAIFGTEDKTLFSDMMTLFVEKGEQDVHDLCEAVTSADVKTIAAISHRLKSSSKTIGAYDLAEYCEFLEQCGKSGDIPDDQDVASEVTARFDIVKQFVIDYKRSI